jgi:hypothetical protein
VATRHVEATAGRLSRLGYTGAVDLLRPLDEVAAGVTHQTVRWRRADMALQRVYEEPDEALRSTAPDRRTFLLECGDGVVRPIAGYRGGPGPLEHRALPVEDARLLVNLVAAPARGPLLEPFAGAGGVVIEARASGWTVVSADRDPTLRFGLRALADLHVVGDAAVLPIRTASVAAVAAEPPHHPSALPLVAASIGELARVLRPGGRMAVLLAAHQAEAVRGAAAEVELTPEVDAAIDRKGTEARCLSWLRAG